MSENEQILKLAIGKAVKGGYKVAINLSLDDSLDSHHSLYALKMIAGHKLIYSIIFSHDFAKAFWGEEVLGGKGAHPVWHWHLQQMVLEDDKLKYLEKFL